MGGAMGQQHPMSGAPPRQYYGEQGGGFQPQSNARMGPQMGQAGQQMRSALGRQQDQSAPARAWGPSITSSLPMSGVPPQVTPTTGMTNPAAAANASQVYSAQAQQPAKAWGPSTSDALSQIGNGMGQAEQPGAPQMEAGGSYMGSLQDAAKVPEESQPIQAEQPSIAPGIQRQRQQQRRMQQRSYYGE